MEIGHGQMDADELEAVMARFIAGKNRRAGVFTTIIESGLDIPNANTIIIDRADQFGLAGTCINCAGASLGRAQGLCLSAFATRNDTVVAARKRISAIKQYSSLGAGFRIAMRDLEIRRRGQHSGHRAERPHPGSGFRFNCQLLKQAVAQLKGQKPRLRLYVDVRLDFVVRNQSRVHKTKERRLPEPSSYR